MDSWTVCRAASFMDLAVIAGIALSRRRATLRGTCMDSLTTALALSFVMSPTHQHPTLHTPLPSLRALFHSLPPHFPSYPLAGTRRATTPSTCLPTTLCRATSPPRCTSTTTRWRGPTALATCLCRACPPRSARRWGWVGRSFAVCAVHLAVLLRACATWAVLSATSASHCNQSITKAYHPAHPPLAHLPHHSPCPSQSTGGGGPHRRQVRRGDGAAGRRAQQAADAGQLPRESAG